MRTGVAWPMAELATYEAAESPDGCDACVVSVPVSFCSKVLIDANGGKWEMYTLRQCTGRIVLKETYEDFRHAREFSTMARNHNLLISTNAHCPKHLGEHKLFAEWHHVRTPVVLAKLPLTQDPKNVRVTYLASRGSHLCKDLSRRLFRKAAPERPESKFRGSWDLSATV